MVNMIYEVNWNSYPSLYHKETVLNHFIMKNQMWTFQKFVYDG